MCEAVSGCMCKIGWGSHYGYKGETIHYKGWPPGPLSFQPEFLLPFWPFLPFHNFIASKLFSHETHFTAKLEQARDLLNSFSPINNLGPFPLDLFAFVRLQSLHNRFLIVCAHPKVAPFH